MAQYSDDFRDDEIVYDLILTNIVHQNALVDLLVKKGLDNKSNYSYQCYTCKQECN